MNNITYRKIPVYKYQTLKEYQIKTGIKPKGGKPGGNDFVHIGVDTVLTIRKGYAWNGASGPTWDTKNSMRPSLVHDAIYQLIQEGIISRSYRAKADKLFYQMCREDGMSKIRAWVWYKSVRAFGHKASKAKKWKVLTAP